MVGPLDFRSHSKSKPFATPPLFDHSKSRLVQISDPYYTGLVFKWLKAIRLSNSWEFKWHLNTRPLSDVFIRLDFICKFNVYSNYYRFLETSAKTNVNIERAFLELSENILEKTPGLQEPRPALPPVVNKGNSSGCCSS